MGGLGDLTAVGSLLGGLAAVYLVVGLLLDAERSLRRRAEEKARANLATVLLADEEPAAEAAERLGRTHPAVLIPLVQRLAADLDGDADRRLRRLVGASGLVQRVGRLARSRRWRRRAQAAALAPLFPDGDARRFALLHDRHPTVRARAALHLETDDAVIVADRLLELLGDPKPAVRFAAQQALLRSDGRIIDALAAFLATPDRPGADLALEVAAGMPDPRLQPTVLAQAHSPDPRRRALATTATMADGPGVALVRESLDDEDPVVRAAGATAAGRLARDELCPELGARLGDPAWTVRLQAGRALAALGPVGALTLRHHLLDRDPYARDMARRALDDIEAHEGRPVLPAAIPPGLDAWTAESVA